MIFEINSAAIMGKSNNSNGAVHLSKKNPKIKEKTYGDSQNSVSGITQLKKNKQTVYPCHRNKTNTNQFRVKLHDGVMFYSKMTIDIQSVISKIKTLVVNSI